MVVANSILAGDFVVWILSIFGTILNTLILISILRKKYCQKQRENPEIPSNSKIITNASVLCIVFYLIFAFLGIIAFSKLIFIDKVHGNITTTRIFRIGACFYIFSNNGLLLFILLLRMNHLSIYPLFFQKITYILPVITSIMVTTPFILSIIDTKSSKIAHSLTIIATMIVIIIYIILMILYLKQISFVMKQRIHSTINENKTNNFDGISEKEKGVEVIIDFNTIQNTVRYSVLVIFCVSSALSVPIWTSIGLALSIRDPSFLSFIAGIGLMIDAIINSISTFFLFGFVKIYYFKFCNICHQFVNNCCIFCVIKSFNIKADIDKQQYKSLIVA